MTNTSTNNSGLIQMYPITPASLKIATRIIYVMIFITGVIGNIMVCYIIIKRYQGNKRRSIHNFTLNLALSDLLVLFIYLPSQLHLFETSMKWKLGEVMCRLTYLIVPLSVYASIGTLIAISRDRYYAVIHPMASLERRSTKRALLCIWVVSFVFTIPLIAVARIQEGYCTEAWPKQFLYCFYWILAFCVQFAIPVFLLTIAHALIVVHLKKLKLPTVNHQRVRVQARRRQQQRMIVMSVTLVLVYVICMLPQHIIFFWMSYGNLQSQPYNMYIFQVANLLQILNSALNPVVYGTLNNDIKRGFVSVFKRGSKARQNFTILNRKNLELQTMTSYYASPLLQSRVSHQNSSANGRLGANESKSISKRKRESNFNRSRNLAVSDLRRKTRSAKYLFEEDSVILHQNVNGDAEEGVSSS
eukprot:gene4391-20616_t